MKSKKICIFILILLIFNLSILFIVDKNNNSNSFNRKENKKIIPTELRSSDSTRLRLNELHSEQIIEGTPKDFNISLFEGIYYIYVDAPIRRYVGVSYADMVIDIEFDIALDSGFSNIIATVDENIQWYFACELYELKLDALDTIYIRVRSNNGNGTFDIIVYNDFTALYRPITVDEAIEFIKLEEFQKHRYYVYYPEGEKDYKITVAPKYPLDIDLYLSNYIDFRSCTRYESDSYDSYAGEKLEYIEEIEHKDKKGYFLLVYSRTGSGLYDIRISEEIEKTKIASENDDFLILNFIILAFIAITSIIVGISYEKSRKIKFKKGNLLFKIKNLRTLVIPHSINLENIRNKLNLNEKTFDKKIIEWVNQFDLKIDNGFLILNIRTIEEFIGVLDKETEGTFYSISS